MKIWYGYSSEHSTSMSIIASFKTEEETDAALRKLKEEKPQIAPINKERRSLYSAHASYFGNECIAAKGKNNKLIISTDMFEYVVLVELLLSYRAEVKLYTEGCPWENILENTPDLREAAESLGYWFDDMYDDLD